MTFLRLVVCSVGKLLVVGIVGALLWGVPARAYDMAPMVVTASRFDEDQDLSPGSISVIRPEKTEGEFKTLPDLLQQSVGVHITEIQGHGGYTVASIRGSTSSQVAVYIDGVLANMASEAAVDLSTIPVDNVERIEVYRGHVPARFGVSGMGAVINVITKEADRADQTVSVGVGSLGEWKLSSRSSFNTGAGRSLLTTEFSGYDGDFSFHNTRDTGGTDADDYEATRQYNGYSYENVLYKWSDDAWKARLSYYHKDRDVPYSARQNDEVISGNPLYQKRTQDTRKWDISLARAFTAGEVEGSVYALFLDQDKHFRDPGGVRRGNMPSWSDFDSSRVEGGFQAGTWLGESQHVGLYGSWAYEDYDVDGDGGYEIYKTKHYGRHELKLTLEDSIFPFEGSDFEVVPMARYNHVGDDEEMSWSTAVSWPFSNHWRLKSSYGHYFRAPNFYEIFGDGVYIVPNEALDPEEGDQWDIGFHWSGCAVGAEATFSVTWFDVDTENLIVFVNKGPFQGRYENVDAAHVEGLEVEVGLNWERDSLVLGYTHMDSENLTQDDQYRGKPLPNRPENVWHVRTQHQFSPVLMGYAEADYFGDNYMDQLGEVIWSDYTKVNLGIKWQVRDDAVLSFGVDDVFDNTVGIYSYGYNTPGAPLTPDYPLEGRTWHISYVWRF